MNQGIGIGIGAGEGVAAAAAGIGVTIDGGGEPLRRDKGSEMLGMARLAARLSPGRKGLGSRFDLGAGRVGRGRFGGIGGIEVKLLFQVVILLLEIKNLLLEIKNLALKGLNLLIVEQNESGDLSLKFRRSVVKQGWVNLRSVVHVTVISLSSISNKPLAL